MLLISILSELHEFAAYVVLVSRHNMLCNMTCVREH